MSKKPAVLVIQEQAFAIQFFVRRDTHLKYISLKRKEREDVKKKLVEFLDKELQNVKI